jgi:hypothetical protein
MARLLSSDAILSFLGLLLIVSNLPGSLAGRFNIPGPEPWKSTNLTLLGPPLGDIPSTCDGLNISTTNVYSWNSSYDLTRRDYNFKPDAGGAPARFPPVFSPDHPARVNFICLSTLAEQLPPQLQLVAVEDGALPRGSSFGQ